MTFIRDAVSVMSGLTALTVIVFSVGVQAIMIVCPFEPFAWSVIWFTWLFLLVPSFICGVIGLPTSWLTLLSNIRKELLERPSSDPLGNLLWRVVVIFYRFIVLPLPSIPNVTTGLSWLIFREPCAYYEPKQKQVEEAENREPSKQYSDELWIYINGIATTKDIADAHRDLLFEMFGRPMHLLHNPTDGMVFDLLECLAWKLGFLENLLNVFYFFARVVVYIFNLAGVELKYTSPESELKERLILALENKISNKQTHDLNLLRSTIDNDQTKEDASLEKNTSSFDTTTTATTTTTTTCTSNPPITKVVLIAHSQGTIIAGNVLTELVEEINEIPEMQNILQNAKLEVFNFANCAHQMPSTQEGLYVENISNGGDIVAWLGALYPPILRRFWLTRHGKSLQIGGTSIVETSLWGHLLSTHYLEPMQKGYYATASQDYNQKGTKIRSRIVSYMHQHNSQQSLILTGPK
mmetsp:Transcript_18983/g.26724  ORF Transcript_18983/g.26724 Transcript_18983/m.26724 type:complete len:466 (-) Transcript_18983:193-1590(-)